MTSRERFEAAAKRHSFGRVSLDRQISPGCLGNGDYLSSTTRRVWSSWRSAERDTLERCLEVLAKNDDISDAEDDLKEILNES